MTEAKAGEKAGMVRRRWEAAALGVGILLTAGAAYLHWGNMCCAGGLWRDEAAFVNIATKGTMGEMWEKFQYESFPMLPLTAMRTWVEGGAGTGDLRLRTWGAMVGLGILGMLWAAGYLMKTGPPLVSVALVGYGAVILRWSDSLRGYGLGMLLIIATFALAWKAVETRKTWWWIAAGTAAVLSVQTLFYNAVFVGAICTAGALILWRRGEKGWWLGPTCMAGAAAASLTPYAWPLAKATTWLATVKGLLSWEVIGHMVKSALNGSTTFMAWVWAAAALATIAGGAMGFAAMRKRKGGEEEGEREGEKAAYAGLALALGMAGYLAYIWWVGYMTHEWHYIVLMGLAAVCAETAIAFWAGKRWKEAAGIALAALIAAGCWNATIGGLSCRQTNIDWAAKTIGKQAKAGDLVVVTPWMMGISFGRYYKGEAEWVTIPQVDDLSCHRYDLVSAKTKDTEAISPIKRKIVETLRSGKRVWVVEDRAEWLTTYAAPKEVPVSERGPGWDSDAYWSQCTAAFLNRWGNSHEKVTEERPRGIMMLENMKVLVYEGLKQ